jgi:flagellar basal-body rod protein FlgF
MQNAQLISLSRQIALQRQMDVVANNIANMNTTGFKAEDMLFEEFVAPIARDNDFIGSDRPVSFVQDWATMHDLSAGAIMQTGNPLDVALQGEGFFAVDTPAGERWTKSGAFQINAEGLLVTLDGNPVMGDGGEIRFDATETDITIGSDGTVSTSAGAKGAIRIVEFANEQELAREGNNLYSGGTPLPNAGTRAVQGALEKSNVSGVAQMTEMIRVQRAYQSLASMVEKQDDIQAQAIKRLGSLNA